MERYVLSDINEELILFYKIAKHDTEKLLLFVEKYYKEYMNLSEVNKEKYYYDLCKIYSHERFNISYNSYSYLFIPQAAQLFFLNRTCYNELFRQNLRAEFNVLYGKKFSPPLVNSCSLIQISKTLRKVDVRYADFQNVCKEIKGPNSFVYFDPPYKPISKNRGFTNYHKTNFTEKDQLRLLDTFNSIGSKTVLILMNNSCITSDIGVKTIESHCKSYNIDYINSSTTMSSKIEYRKKINELAITNS